MRHLELFAGIGGFRRAIDLVSKDAGFYSTCVGFSEIDANAIKTYKSNFQISSDEVELGDIVAFTADEKNIIKLPDFDLLTAGFPCQPFSMMGSQQGFKEERGQMFFRILDILNIKKPRFVLLENVKNLFTHDKGRTYKKIISELNALGYNVVSGIFNTADFHLPQKRSRVLIFATTDTINEQFINTFTPKNVKRCLDDVINDTSLFNYESVVEILAKNVEAKYFLSEQIKPTILSNGSLNYKSNSEINQDIARPLTASMHKMHRACQDNYYSQGYIETEGRRNEAKYLSKDEQAKLPIRKLTPQEAFQLQGFPSVFALNAKKAGVSDGALYKQAGNAVSINTIYAVLYFIFVKNKDIWRL